MRRVTGIVVAALLVAQVVACESARSVRVPVLYANESTQDLVVRVTDDGGAGPSTTASYRLDARSEAVLADQAFFGAEVLSEECVAIGYTESTGLLGDDPAPAYLRVVVSPDLRVSIAPVAVGDALEGEDPNVGAVLTPSPTCRP
jgi:hypothetical protein